MHFFGHFVVHVDLFHAYWVHFIHSSVWIPAVDQQDPYQHFQSDEVAHTVFTHKMHWLLLTDCFSILSSHSTFYYKQHNTHWYSSIPTYAHTAMDKSGAVFSTCRLKEPGIYLLGIGTYQQKHPVFLLARARTALRARGKPALTPHQNLDLY